MSSPAEVPVIAAAGGVVWRATVGDGDDGIEIAVVHRQRYDDWSLPKGKLDAGEHAVQAAVREVLEETGLGVVVGRRGPTTRYDVEDVPKRVDYWLMRWAGGEFLANAECDQLRWLRPDDAAALLTHGHDRRVIADAARTDLPREVSVLLVRHGKAGNSERWEGPDGERPLTSAGEEQARDLARVLPLFGPTSVESAPPLRCRQTVAPLAQRLELAVRATPELGEEGFATDPQAGLSRVEELLAAPGVAAVCSQGGAIPAVLQALGVHGHGVTGLLPPAAKGSVWALGGRAGSLSADYYRDVTPDPDAPSP